MLFHMVVQSACIVCMDKGICLGGGGTYKQRSNRTVWFTICSIFGLTKRLFGRGTYICWGELGGVGAVKQMSNRSVWFNIWSTCDLAWRKNSEFLMRFNFFVSNP